MPNTVSTAEAVRRWVDEAPAESVLDGREAPGAPSNATRVALSRLACDPESAVSLVRRHVYWKDRYPQAGLIADFGPGLPAPADHLAAALVAAGPGSGWAGYSAARLFGWTHQVLLTPEAAVVGRPPRGFEERVVLYSRSNTARFDLRPHEVALLEATIGFVRTGFDIEYKPGHSHYCEWAPENPHDDSECLWDWPGAVAVFTASLNDYPKWSFDPAALQRVAAGEWQGGKEMRDKIGDLADAIADSQQPV